MTAKTWRDDFRDAAIRESVAALQGAAHEDPLRFPGSLCLPVGDTPRRLLTPGKIMLLYLLLGLSLLGGGGYLGLGQDRPGFGMILFVAGLGCLFLPVTTYRFVLMRLLGDRGTQAAQGPGASFCLEISNADVPPTTSIEADDYALLIADAANQRVLIEGLRARYFIRAQDVLELQPYEFANYLGVEIAYRINERATLRLAVARVSMALALSQALRLVGSPVKNPIFEACGEALRSAERVSLERLPDLPPELD